MRVRFKPHVTERRFKKLAYGEPGDPGLVYDWVGIDLCGDLDGQYRLVMRAKELLGVDILEQALHTTFGPLWTGVIKKEQLEFICWRIVANLDVLATDRAIPEWSGLRGVAVAPVQVVHTQFGWSAGKEKRAGTVLTLRVIDGELCPIRFRRWYPNKFLFVLASDIGIRARRSRLSFEHRGQLYGMRFVAQLAPSKYERGGITIERHDVGQFMSYNQQLMRRRAKECPLDHTWECHECTLGEDSCPDRRPISRACRPVSLKLVHCALCGDVTWHDKGKCVRCRHRQPVIA